MFETPVIVAQCGGSDGGGAWVTAFGREIVQRYRVIEAAAARATELDLGALEAAARSVAPTAR
jgi:molybdate transport system regulatory protein